VADGYVRCLEGADQPFGRARTGDDPDEKLAAREAPVERMFYLPLGYFFLLRGGRGEILRPNQRQGSRRLVAAVSRPVTKKV